MMRFADLELTLVSDGGFRLDGGAMFGVVPRVLWEKQKAADARHRIDMATNCLLVRRGDDLLLVDSGIGDKNDAQFRDLFGLEEGATRLPESIRLAGYEPEDVTHVLLTHLHFDHCGWNTREVAGSLVPTFPRARYWLARGEVEHARQPNARDRASYDPRNWEPLFAAGVVELWDDAATPIPGVTAVKAPGHNRDMAIVTFGEGESDDDIRAVFWADLIPTAAHVATPWVMGYDLYPVETMENKDRWLRRAADGGWLSIFEHEAGEPLGRLVEERPGRFRSEAVELTEGRWTTEGERGDG